MIGWQIKELTTIELIRSREIHDKKPPAPRPGENKKRNLVNPSVL